MGEGAVHKNSCWLWDFLETFCGAMVQAGYRMDSWFDPEGLFKTRTLFLASGTVSYAHVIEDPLSWTPYSIGLCASPAIYRA